MKINFKTLLFTVILLMAFTTTAFAINVNDGNDVTDPNGLIAILNPVIVFLALQASKLVTKIAPGWLLGVLVPGLSAAGAFVLNWANPDSGFLVTFLVGFGATFIHQLKNNLVG